MNQSLPFGFRVRDDWLIGMLIQDHVLLVKLMLYNKNNACVRYFHCCLPRGIIGTFKKKYIYIIFLLFVCLL